ncbi:carbohydrate-binding protein [Chitinolyticbacter meiyuanensis]|uniref:carbohydrate-binding protein n=1 Tax=Chitinolyticbacter meiyuanensis TaxID=682798 RepID=UPI0011E5A631|nr:carbohydrate-binding protein [Chitinolyticbacter meiyuanensis]
MKTIITALTLAGAMLAAQAHASPHWREGRDYRAGEVVEYRGQQWRVVQSHTAWRGAGWTPEAAHSLWEPARGHRDRRYYDGRGHDTGQWRGPSGYPGDPGYREDKPWRRDPHWRPAGWGHDRGYHRGEWVWYDGYAYQARRDVGSSVSVNWRPDRAPDVWLKVRIP